mgnify:CR=1 FL=1
MIVKQCKECGNSFIADRNRRVFCNQTCSANFNNKQRGPVSEEQKKKTSKALREFYSKNPEKILRGKQKEILAGTQTKGKYKSNPKNIFDMSHRTRSKIIKRLKLNCFRCGWKEGTCDIHHINGRKIDDPHNHMNLISLCPNCHRLVGEKKIDISDYKTFHDAVGDKWKEVYYG